MNRQTRYGESRRTHRAKVSRKERKERLEWQKKKTSLVYKIKKELYESEE